MVVIGYILMAISLGIFTYRIIKYYNNKNINNKEVKNTVADKSKLDFLEAYKLNTNYINSFVTYFGIENNIEYFVLYLLDSNNKLLSKDGILIRFNSNETVNNYKDKKYSILTSCKIKATKENPVTIKDFTFDIAIVLPYLIANKEGTSDTVEGLLKKNEINNFIAYAIFVYKYYISFESFLRKEGLFENYTKFIVDGGSLDAGKKLLEF
jgi:hypothetical protein